MSDDRLLQRRHRRGRLAQHAPRAVAAPDAQVHAAAGDLVEDRQRRGGHARLARRRVRDARPQAHRRGGLGHQRQQRIGVAPQDVRVEQPAVREAGRLRLAGEARVRSMVWSGLMVKPKSMAREGTPQALPPAMRMRLFANLRKCAIMMRAPRDQDPYPESRMSRPFTRRSAAALLLLGALVVTGCAPQAAADADLTAPSAAGATAQPGQVAALPAEISVDEASRLRDAGAFILDVRQPDEWAAGHIPDATLIPLGELAARVCRGADRPPGRGRLSLGQPERPGPGHPARRRTSRRSPAWPAA